MKNQFFALLLALSCVLMPSCGAGHADSPLDAIERFKQAVISADRQAIMASLDKPSKDFDEEFARLMEAKPEIASLEIAEVKAVGDVAVAIPKDEGHRPLLLVRRSNRWFIADDKDEENLFETPDQKDQLSTWYQERMAARRNSK